MGRVGHDPSGFLTRCLTWEEEMIGIAESEQLLREAVNAGEMVLPDNVSIDDVSVGCDFDIDGLNDYDESKVYSTDPNVADTDGDGFSDGEEIWVLGTNPRDAADP